MNRNVENTGNTFPTLFDHKNIELYQNIFKSHSIFYQSLMKLFNISSAKIWRSCLFFLLMVWKAATVAFLAGLSTYWSYKFDVLVNLNGINLVTVAVVFPLVFAVNAAYQRRQHALRSLDILKGTAFSLRLCFALWAKANRPSRDLLKAADVVLEKFFADLKRYLSHKKLSLEVEEEVITTFVALSILVENLRADSVPPPELSLANRLIRDMVVEFETLKTMHVYRTPTSLLFYIKSFLILIPIVYGPVFAYISKESGHASYGILLAVLFAVVLIALDNTQDVLENPYDGLSPDDIQFRKPVAILRNRVTRTWSEAVPYAPKLTSRSTYKNSEKAIFRQSSSLSSVVETADSEEGQEEERGLEEEELGGVTGTDLSDLLLFQSSSFSGEQHTGGDNHCETSSPLHIGSNRDSSNTVV